MHSQEHGWTIVWYDEPVADESTFPDGTHVAVTHWTATATKDGTEWRQFCATANTAAVSAFKRRHPSTDAHEPFGP